MEKKFKTVELNRAELMKELGISSKEVETLFSTIDEKAKVVDRIIDMLIDTNKGPVDAISNGFTAIGNIAISVGRIDVQNDDRIMKHASILIQMFKDKGYDDYDIAALLSIAGTLLFAPLEFEDIFNNAKKNEAVSQAKEEAKKEATNIVDGLFDGSLSEQELAKRIASLISKSKQNNN